MYKDSTTDLKHRLLDPSGTRSQDSLKEENRVRTGRELIDAWLCEHEEVVPADIVRACQGYLSRSYVYDILSGTKTAPSRNTVIMIALALRMDVKSADRLLKAFGHRDLYPRDGSDLTVIQCITEGKYAISEVNDRLSAGGYPLLGEG